MSRDLVFLQNNKVVTDSLTVAEVFEKDHDKVMRDINIQLKKLEEAAELDFSTANFVGSIYEVRGKRYAKYDLTEEAFTLVAMSYTTPEAMKMKVMFIQEFKRIKEQLNSPRVLSEREQLVASLKLTLETSEEVTAIKTEVKEIRYMVQEQITLDHGEQRRIQKAVGTKVYELSTNPATNPRLFSELYKDIKDRFGVGSYKDIKRHDMQKAIRYIEAWVPRKAIS